MTRLAIETGAVNLSQGFPDFEGPRRDRRRRGRRPARRRRTSTAGRWGCRRWSRQIARHQDRCYGLRFDPLTEVCAFAGATEGIAAAMLGLLEPGDEVVLFEPFYDSYPATIAMAGAVPARVTLRFPGFGDRRDRAARRGAPRTRAVMINSPHNPSGHVLSDGELDAIARSASSTT